MSITSTLMLVEIISKSIKVLRMTKGGWGRSDRVLQHRLEKHIEQNYPKEISLEFPQKINLTFVECCIQKQECVLILKAYLLSNKS